MTMNRNICSAIALMLAAAAASAQPSDPLRLAVEQAVNTNPEVTARFNAYRASVDAVDVARAGYLPRLDLNANVGRDSEPHGGPNENLLDEHSAPIASAIACGREEREGRAPGAGASAPGMPLTAPLRCPLETVCPPPG